MESFGMCCRGGVRGRGIENGVKHCSKSLLMVSLCMLLCPFTHKRFYLFYFLKLQISKSSMAPHDREGKAQPPSVALETVDH